MVDIVRNALFPTTRHNLQAMIMPVADTFNRTPLVVFDLEHIIVPIHVHISLSSFYENESGPFRGGLPHLRSFLSAILSSAEDGKKLTSSKAYSSNAWLN